MTTHAPRPGRRGVVGSALLATVAACSLAACGGSSSSSAPSQAGYVKQANAICNADKGRLQNLSNQLSTASDQATAVRTLQTVISTLQQQHAKLTALRQPSGGNPAVAKALGAQQAVLGDLTSLITAVNRNDSSVVQSQQGKMTNDGKAYDSDFQAAGLPGCVLGSE